MNHSATTFLDAGSTALLAPAALPWRPTIGDGDGASAGNARSLCALPMAIADSCANPTRRVMISNLGPIISLKASPYFTARAVSRKNRLPRPMIEAVKKGMSRTRKIPEAMVNTL